MVVAALSVNTLRYSPELCINCGLCSVVCPHGVFQEGSFFAELARRQACMECGACQRNCPADAIRVDSGVGCAAAMIQAILLGRKEVTCGCGGEGEGETCC